MNNSSYKSESQRVALGMSLIKYGQRFDNLFVVSPDVGLSTHASDFQKIYPERYVNTGISEQNTMGVAAGLALVDFIPIVPLYAAFASGKSADQVINSIAYPNLNVKIIGTHGGINVGGDGPTHQAIIDLAFFRSIPNFKVLVPRNSSEVDSALRISIENEGPFYIRLERESIPEVNVQCESRLGHGCLIKQGGDITVITIGSMLNEALNASNMLEIDNISIRVIDMFSLKPLDIGLISDACKETKGIVTVEDHNKYGGLFSAVSECVVGFSNSLIPVKSISVNDTFAESGDGKELRCKHGLTSENIVLEVKKLMNLDS